MATNIPNSRKERDDAVLGLLHKSDAEVDAAFARELVAYDALQGLGNEQLNRDFKAAQAEKDPTKRVALFNKLITAAKAAKKGNPSKGGSSNGGTDDSVAPAWFTKYTEQFGATDSDGKPTKAAADSELQQLKRVVDDHGRTLGAWGFCSKTINDHPVPIYSNGSLAHRLSNTASNGTMPGLKRGAIAVAIVLGLAFLGWFFGGFVLGHSYLMGPVLIGGLVVAIIVFLLAAFVVKDKTQQDTSTPTSTN